MTQIADQPEHKNPDERSIPKVYATFLESELLKKARAVRMESFIRLARIRGISVEQLEAESLQSMKQAAETQLRYYDAGNDDPFHRKLFEVAARENTYWAYVEAQEEYTRFTLIDIFFQKNLHKEPMNHGYLSRIAAALPTPVKELRSTTDLDFVLMQIPLIYRQDLEFNAFISRAWPDSPVPFISVNNLLLKSHDIFSVQMATQLLEETQVDGYATAFKMRSDDKVITNSKESSTIFNIFSITEFMLGRTPHLLRFDPDHDGETVFSHVTAPPAINFVKFHEYGHLMFGHLERPWTKDMEFQADAYAAIYINKMLEGKKDVETYGLFIGLCSLFMLMLISEKVNPVKNHEYPTTFERIQSLILCFPMHNRKPFVLIWNKLVKAVWHTINASYQIDVPRIDLHFQNPENGKAENPAK